MDINKIKYNSGFKNTLHSKIKFKLIDTNNIILNDFFVDAKDRQYQFWKRNPLGIDLWTKEVFTHCPGSCKLPTIIQRRDKNCNEA